MTEKSAYGEHIEHTFNAYCMIVIRHAAIDAGRTLRQKWRQEISLEYLTEDKHFPLGTTDEYFAEPELEGGISVHRLRGHDFPKQRPACYRPAALEADQTGNAVSPLLSAAHL